ncbi:MAG: CBS domain-containing protein [Chloroflexota bacterium]
MGGSFRFGRVLGIPLYAHYSWLAIFVLSSFNLTVLTAMAEGNVNQVPVVDEQGQVMGLVTRERLLDLVRARAGLKV